MPSNPLVVPKISDRQSVVRSSVTCVGIERIQKNGFVMQFFVSQRGIRDKFDALEKGEEEMTALAVPSHAFAPLSLQHAQEQSGFLLWTPLTLYIVATNKY